MEMKMQVIISGQDVRNIGATAIAQMLSQVFSLEQGDLNKDEIIAVLSLDQAREYLNGVGEKTKESIRLLVKNGGRMRLSEFKKETGISNYWAGFLSPTTKRVKTVLNNDHAKLVGWDNASLVYEGRQFIDGDFFLDPLTQKSFRALLEPKA